jgi:phosphoglycerate dehydrogenase-like enzyme
MRAYSIFDDFTQDAVEILVGAGVELTVHPVGVPRPDHDQMKAILEEYDCVIIGTSQKITEDMFEHITAPRIIATASVGLDHIRVPEEKKTLVTIINTPKANAQSVAEYTMACALSCVKRLAEGNKLYSEGKNNKALHQKPEDLSGKTIGVIGAGNISTRIMEYATFFGMKVLCWTRNPVGHKDLESKGVQFVGLEELVKNSDVISVNLPNNAGTKGILSESLVELMKPTAIFISISRLDTIDFKALLQKTKDNPSFYLCLDIDVCESIVQDMRDRGNIMITPHIAGGTVETRRRMFIELAKHISKMNTCD